MKAVSLFAGVGGFDLALENNGVQVVANVEIDAKARKILAKHFPNAKQFDDVKAVTGEQLFEAGFEREGIIVGGFPCQDLSVAGKQAGLAGERSGLFWEICRLLDETQAQHFILENVPGLLSSNNGRDLGIVIGALVERGYGVAYRILNAEYYGIPQRRKRIFIVGSLGDDGSAPAKILAIGESQTRHINKNEQEKQTNSRSVKESVLKTWVKSRRAQNSEDYETWVESNVSPTLNVFDNNGDVRATVLIANEETSIIRRLTPLECERLQGFPDNWTEGQSDSVRYKQMGNAVAVPVVDWIVKRLLENSTTAG